MKKKHTLPVIAGMLTISAALIAGLASADMKPDRIKKSMMYAKKLDTDTDGAISLDELTARQDRRFAKIDQNSNGLIDKNEFNARLIAMFTRMDRNDDGLLRDDELPRQGYGKRHHHRHDHHDKNKTANASTNAN